MIFESLPTMMYKINGKFVSVTDIFRRVSINKFADNFSILETVTVPDGMRPEDVADKYYNNPDFYYVILIVNEIIDPRTQWPISNNQVIEYAKRKYGEGNLYRVHHYRKTDDSQLIVDYDADLLGQGLIEEVSNIQYEEELNDSKREIKVVKQNYISRFVDDLYRLYG